jgi:hypothetical protein
MEEQMLRNMVMRSGAYLALVACLGTVVPTDAWAAKKKGASNVRKLTPSQIDARARQQTLDLARANGYEPVPERYTGVDDKKVRIEIRLTSGQEKAVISTAELTAIKAIGQPMIVVVQHTTSGLSDDQQLLLDLKRAISLRPAICDRTTRNLCRWGRVLIDANNATGSVMLVERDGTVSVSNVTTLIADVEALKRDADKDGIKDIDDKCPTVHAGSTPDPFNIGCPDQDSDSDGLTDHHGDNCPQVPGPKENKGCPLPPPNKY